MRKQILYQFRIGYQIDKALEVFFLMELPNNKGSFINAFARIFSYSETKLIKTGVGKTQRREMVLFIFNPKTLLVS